MSIKNINALFLILITSLFVSACNPKVMEVKGPRSTDYQNVTDSKTVVFIHGMYLTPNVWTSWERYFQSAGYETHSPAWPLHELSVEELNALHPSDTLGALTLAQVLQHYRDFIATLDEPPILIGHSMGGLITQLLLTEGIGAAGIAIDSAPPQGVISTSPVFLQANLPHLNPLLKASIPTQLTFKQFQFGFANGMDEATQQTLFEQHIVPESRRVGRATLTTQAKIRTKLARPPLLIIAGGKDHTIPAGLSFSNFKIYGDTPAVTDYKKFPERNHLTIIQVGWEDLADYSAQWIAENKLPYSD